MLPLVSLACSQRHQSCDADGALAGIGLFGMIGRVLRNPVPLRGPTSSPLPAGNGGVSRRRRRSRRLPAADHEEFPGLEQTGSAFARLTAVPLWPVGLAVVVLAHVLSVLAIYQLVRMVGAPARGAAVGAVVYTLNPSWLYFDALFSYESLALPLMLWCLAATIAAGRATEKLNVRAIAMAVFCVVGLPVIHHLTTIMLCFILILLIVARIVPFVRQTAIAGRRATTERIWPLIFIACCLLVSIVNWWAGLYSWLVVYLGPAWALGYEQLQKILNGESQASQARSPFEGAANPPYEIISGYLLPFVLLVLVSWSVVVLWRNRRRVGSAAWAFAVLAGMFFASLPMVLTAGGGEGAHRSWAHSFIGIAVVCGLAWSLAPLRTADAGASRWRWMTKPFGRPGVRVGVVGIVFTVIALGSAAVGTNVPHRFPGVALVGEDAKSVSRESGAVAMWLAAHTPVDTSVIADRFVSLQIGSLGRMATLRPSTTFPIWDLYMSAEPVRLEVLKSVLDAKIKYFVVDARMATTRPLIGYWFTRDEPGARGEDVFPQAALDRFNCLPWLQGVFAAGPLTVYEVSAYTLRRTRAASCEGSEA